MSHSLGMQHGSILASMSNPLPPPHGLLVIAGDYEAMSMSVWPPDSKTAKIDKQQKTPTRVWYKNCDSMDITANV